MIEIKDMKIKEFPIIYFDIEYLEDGNEWIDINGRMLFHFVSKWHISGTYIFGMDDRGLFRISSSNCADKDEKGLIKIVGVDVI